MKNIDNIKDHFKNNGATIHDVANVVGVSATTIWRALNNKPRVSQATKTRIEDVAKKLNYRPSLVAQTLRTQKTNIIGVMVQNWLLCLQNFLKNLPKTSILNLQ